MLATFLAILARRLYNLTEDALNEALTKEKALTRAECEEIAAIIEQLCTVGLKISERVQTLTTH